jgi:plastocyanin
MLRNSGFLNLFIGGYMAESVRPGLIPVMIVLVGAAGLSCGGDDNSGTPPSSIAIAKTSGDGQEGRVGQTLVESLTVTVTDGGAPAVGATVTWSVTAGGGAVDPGSVATDADGQASTSWTLGTTSGSQTVQAALAGAAGSPQTFTAQALVGEPVSLEEAGGNGQSAAVGAPLPSPVQAKVADEFGSGVPGVDVSWTATGGTVSAATVTSDAAGVSAVNVTAGATPGPITIIATAEGLAGSPLTFSANATEAPTTASVSVVNFSFNPASLTISAGTTVVWTWGPGAIQHNVVPVGTQPTKSGDPANAPHTYQFKFDTPGTYTYFCQVHGSPSGGMRGTITVQ